MSTEVSIDTGPVILSGNLEIPDAAGGVVLFAHGRRSSRVNPPNRYADGAIREDAGEITTLNTAKGHTARRIDHVFGAPGESTTLVPGAGRLILDEPVDGVWGSDHFGVLVELQPTPLP